MRTYELALLVINVLTLTLAFGKPARSVRLWAVGVNVLALLLHRLVEGFRYQMLFAYLFVLLLAGYTLLRENARIDQIRLPAFPLSGRQRSYPVVLYSHGAGASMEVETSPCEDLASRGYIVVAIDHPYISAATAFPDRIVRSREATTDFDVPEPAGIIADMMAEDAAFVIDRLSDLNAGIPDATFKGKLDLDRIGAAGHSVGGAAAYNLALDDNRIKAAVNVDGFVYRAPGKNAEAMPPLLVLANDKYHIQLFRERQAYMPKLEDMSGIDRKIALDIYGSKEAYAAEYEKSRRSLNGIADAVKASGDLYTIQGSDHMKFTDNGLFIGFAKLRDMIGIQGKTEPARCLEITQALTAAFLDRHLKGESADGQEALPKQYPELQKIAVPEAPAGG